MFSQLIAISAIDTNNILSHVTCQFILVSIYCLLYESNFFFNDSRASVKANGREKRETILDLRAYAYIIAVKI